MKYRPEIDGLRAISILLILIYHIDPLVIPGGFVGVDVFFVISGYLITKNITDDLSADRFSFGNFYARRIKRIFPSVLLVLLACLVVGWHGLFAHEYAILGKHVAASGGFVSNFVYQAEAGYFDLDSASKPLLHLWSLAVEEQFYLLWPLIIWGTWRVARLGHHDAAQWTRRAIILVVAISLGLAGYLHLTDPSRVFYLSPARAWELGIGALLARLPLDRLGARQQAWLAWLGILLVVGAGTLLNHDLMYPGYWVLLPVLGSACLLIVTQPSVWVGGRILISRPMTSVGVLSFSIYLWHWPLIYFMRTFGWSQAHPAVVWLAAPGSILLAWLSYRLVERPIRYARSAWVAVALFTSMVLVGGVGWNVYSRDGMEFRERMALEDFGGLVEESDAACLQRFAAYAPKFCRLHDPDRPVDVLLLGDSIGHNAFWGVAKDYARLGSNVAMIGWPGVAPVLVPASDRKLYEGDIDQRLNLLLAHINDFPSVKTLVLSYRLPYELPPQVRHQVSATLDLLQAQKRDIVFLMPPPSLPFNPIDCYGLPPLRPTLRSVCEVRESEMKPEYFAARDEMRRMLAKLDIPYFDAHQAICADGNCSLTLDGKVIYRTIKYLTAEGSAHVYTDMSRHLSRK
ncbi:MAG: acyltransferase [Hylemonella sp.]|nr:acyltransferase [Hylemonella sp.]